ASVGLALAAPESWVVDVLTLTEVYDSAAMIVLAGVLRTFPYALLVVWPAVRSIPPAFLDAAAVDGLGPWGQAVKVALPMTREAGFTRPTEGKRARVRSGTTGLARLGPWRSPWRP